LTFVQYTILVALGQHQKWTVYNDKANILGHLKSKERGKMEQTIKNKKINMLSYRSDRSEAVS